MKATPAGKTVMMNRCANCGQVIQRGPHEWWHSDTGLAECENR